MNDPIHQMLCRRHPGYAAWHQKTRNLALMWSILFMVVTLNALTMVQAINQTAAVVGGS